ncbi:MAG: hypothetical protein NVSMB9_27640 [Isosphaeraceae bacterium]
MRRFAMLAVSLSLLLGLTGARYLFAQVEKTTVKKEETRKDETKKEEPKKEETKKDEPKKEESKKEETKKDEPLPPIPPWVEAKLQAARRAVAEAIVAAQDAGLVKTSIDPPPILDILITGRATDESTLKAHTGVSPEVFGAWFTGYGKTEGIVAQNDVRITQPSAGLKTLYEQRASFLNREIEAVRKANGTSKPKDEPKKDEPKKDESKKDESKKDESKKDEPKKDETKKDETKKDEPKKDEPKKDEPKKDEPKKDESKKDESK